MNLSRHEARASLHVHDSYAKPEHDYWFGLIIDLEDLVAIEYHLPLTE